MPKTKEKGPLMRKSSMRIIFALFIFMISLPAAVSAQTESIAAVVNEDAVSESDVIDRMRLVIASSGLPNTVEMRERVRANVVNMLIEEKLKLQELERVQIEIAPEEIDAGFAEIAARNKYSPEQFRAVLQRAGVTPKTLEDQIRSEIAWSKIIQSEIRPKIIIADAEIDAVLDRLQASRGKTEYRVSEIFLPIEKPADEPDVRKLADKLMRQLKEGNSPFQRLASQFSQAAGATKGGDLGWVQEGQLPEAVDQVLGGMSEGQTSNPIRSLAGYHIIELRAKRQMTETNMPSRAEVMNNLGMERLDRQQRSYLLDLKTAAFIERRDS